MSNLRKIRFKYWIPAAWTEGVTQNCDNALPGTNCMTEDFIGEGYFHEWKTDGHGNVSAIIEKPNGEIVVMGHMHVKFEQETQGYRVGCNHPKDRSKSFSVCANTVEDATEMIKKEMNALKW